MKKNYFWYGLLGLLALYLITIAFIPGFHIFFSNMLMLALFFMLIALSNRSIFFFFLALGFLSIYLKDIFHFDYSTGPLFTGIIIIGVILNSFLKPHYSYSYKGNHYFNMKQNANYIDNETDVFLKILFSENTSYVTSQELNKIIIDTKFGEQSVDLSQAQFMTDSPEIHIDVSFGETNLRIPNNWKIINKTHSPFASISFSGFPSTNGDFINVTLTGTVAMGSLNIQY
ncbi:TPA: hdrR negative regulator HdrM [Streptococcus mutans]